jgi:hypothetical protein
VKIESPSFTISDLRRVVGDELAEVERRSVVTRLRDVSARMKDIALRVPEQPPTSDGEWNAKEVLAHIAVASKGWGALAYMAAKARMPELVGQKVIVQRDPLAMEMMGLPVAEITNQAAHAHERSLSFLEGATLDELYTPVRWELGEVAAADLFRLMLVAHVEQHVVQLETALAG